MGVEAGARGGATERDHAETRKRALDALNAQTDLCGVPTELLAQCHRHGVHEVRAPGLHQVLELHGLVGKCLLEAIERRQQRVCDLVECCQMHGRREHVVGTLPHVHVIVGVHALDLAAGDLGDHLVGVHVGRCARTGLEHIHRELVVELALGHGHAGLGDCGGDTVVKQAELGVGASGTRLDAPEPVDDGGRNRLARNRKVVDRLVGLPTPQLCHDVSLFRINGRARLPTPAPRGCPLPHSRPIRDD